MVPVDGKEGGIFDAVCTVDISAGGLGCVSRNPVPLQKQIPVEVELGPGEDPALLMAEVQWVRPCGRGRDYRIGLKFIKVLAEGSRSRLAHYVGG